MYAFGLRNLELLKMDLKYPKKKHIQFIRKFIWYILTLNCVINGSLNIEAIIFNKGVTSSKVLNINSSFR